VNYIKTVFDNGLILLTIPVPYVRSVAISVFVGVGSRYEPDEDAGVCHLIEHMLFKGSSRWPTARDISEAIEGIGGVINASTGRETTLYWVKIAQPHEHVALELLADMLMHPIMDPEEFAKEQRVVIEEINMLYDSPESLAQITINNLVWPAHPLGRDISGTRESVRGITRDKLLAYMDQFYGPPCVVISIAGAIEPEQTRDQIASLFQDWRKVPGRDPLPYQDFPHATAKVVFKDTEQAHICLGFPGLSRNHPDRFVLTLANTILGDGMSSRLFQEIRERQALAYSVDSYISFLRDTGMLGIYAGVDPSRAEPALEAIVRELRRMRDEPVSADELARAKEFNKGRLLLQMENTSAIASWYGRQEILPGDVLSVDDVIAQMEAATPEDIQRVMQAVLDRDRFNIAVVGPFEQEDRFAGFLSAL
jgi:predicted Zn-dependent peptidase